MNDLSGSPAGFIGVIAAELARYSLFGAALSELRTPPGTVVRWEIGTDIAGQCNGLVRQFLADPRAAWFFLLGDDHSFAPDLLANLLDVPGYDVVFPLCLERNPPYRPVLHDRWADDTEEGPARHVLDLDEYPHGGIVPIHSGGSAGMLVYRRVLEAMTPPWFRSYAVSEGGVGEDIYFCDRVRGAGYRLGANLDVSLGHITTGVVWPLRTEWGWRFAFTMAGGHHVIDEKGWNR